MNATIVRLFRPFMRSHETHQFAGIAYYVFGVAASSILFPRTCATIGILTLASLDPIAALCGTFFQPAFPSLRLRHGKSLAGAICACSVAAVLVYFVVERASLSSLKPADAWMIAVLVAWVGSLAEFSVPSPRPTFGPPGFPIGFDDNAIIPILCAATARFILRTTYHKLELSSTIL